MPESIDFAALMSGGWQDLVFEPFREGVRIHYLYREAESPDTPVWALLQYQPGAAVPRHRHTGLETVIVLAGSQSDERGLYQAGTVVCNPQDTVHRVWSDEGCTVLIQWARPVEIL